MNQLRKLLDQVLHVLAGGSFLAMVALTCWQVFTRYILKNPSSWSEELVSYLLIRSSNPLFAKLRFMLPSFKFPVL